MARDKRPTRRVESPARTQAGQKLTGPLEQRTTVLEDDLSSLEGSFLDHKARHQNGGADELNVAGLNGVLADPQTPAAHKVSHENGGADEISIAGLSGVAADPQTPAAHAASHENGGGDEIDVTGLTGVLADPQTPAMHGVEHEAGGSDPFPSGASGTFTTVDGKTVTVAGGIITSIV